VIRSLWLQEALAGAAPPQSLAGDDRADVCIVGGGYTGLWTAIRLKELEPSLDVALVEADVCGGGASGRNGGFVLSWWSKFGTLLELAGADEARRLARASADAVAEIGAFCAGHDIDARYRYDGWLWATTNAAQEGSWRPTIEVLANHGEHPFVELDPQEVAARTGSPVHLGGVLETTGAVVQPARLARGLMRVAGELGVRIYERSPMRSVQPVPGGVRVRTAAGSIMAERVILAMNAWGVRFREIRRRVLVVGSDVVATEPVPERLAEIGWTDGLTISDDRLLVHYYRRTDDGRIAFGRGGGELGWGGRLGPRFQGTTPHAAATIAGFRRTYPMLADVRITNAWSGPIDRTRSGMPYFARLGGRPEIVYGLGYSGNGVGPSNIGGRILASMALGRDDEWSGCALAAVPRESWPPEPFRFVGGSLLRDTLARTERAEDEGRRPAAVDRALLRVAPLGIVPMKVRG
jgi:putative aminophosphonate oxidoreductase